MKYLTYFLIFNKHIIFLKLFTGAAPLTTLCPNDRCSACPFKAPLQKGLGDWSALTGLSKHCPLHLYLWYHDVTVLTVRLKAQFVKAGCVHLYVDWVLWYINCIYVNLTLYNMGTWKKICHMIDNIHIYIFNHIGKIPDREFFKIINVDIWRRRWSLFISYMQPYDHNVYNYYTNKQLQTVKIQL